MLFATNHSGNLPNFNNDKHQDLELLPLKKVIQNQNISKISDSVILLLKTCFNDTGTLKKFQKRNAHKLIIYPEITDDIKIIDNDYNN